MIVLGWIRGFALFWYRFIIGDDWTIAATVGLGLVAVYALLRNGIQGWWLMPLAVAGILAVSLWRTTRHA